MTAQPAARCDYTVSRTGVHCESAGTVDPDRWHGCLCEGHARLVAFVTPGILPALIATLERFVADRQEKAA